MRWHIDHIVDILSLVRECRDSDPFCRMSRVIREYIELRYGLKFECFEDHCICPICKQRLRRKAGFKNHLRRKWCGKVLRQVVMEAYRAYSNARRLVKKKRGVYYCAVCGKVFERRPDALHHIVFDHLLTPPYTQHTPSSASSRQP